MIRQPSLYPNRRNPLRAAAAAVLALQLALPQSVLALRIRNSGVEEKTSVTFMLENQLSGMEEDPELEMAVQYQTPGEFLYVARVNKELTMKDVADATGVNKATISRYEADKSLPDKTTVVQWGQLLGFDGDDVYRNKIEPIRIAPDLYARLKARRLVARMERAKMVPFLKAAKGLLKSLQPLSQSSSVYVTLDEAIRVLVQELEENLEKDMVPIRGTQKIRWGAFIRFYREENGLTTNQLGEKMGRDKAMISRIEDGQIGAISLERADFLGSVLGFDGETLFFKEIDRIDQKLASQLNERFGRTELDFPLLKAGVAGLRELSSLISPKNAPALEKSKQILELAMSHVVASMLSAGVEESRIEVAVHAHLLDAVRAKFGNMPNLTWRPFSTNAESAEDQLKDFVYQEGIRRIIILDEMYVPNERQAAWILPEGHAPAVIVSAGSAAQLTPDYITQLLQLPEVSAGGIYFLRFEKDRLRLETEA